MAITVDNSMSGPAGVQPTTARLAATGTPVAALASPSTLLSSAEHTVHGLSMVRVRSGYHRYDTGRITWPLPAGAWALRIYVWAPYLRPSVDILERRHLIDFGTHAVVLRESTGRNALLRLQPADLAAAEAPTSDTGSARAINRLLRVELVYDGTGTLTGRIYHGDDTTTYRENSWSLALSASQVTFSAYRWFKYTTLGPGSTDATTGGQVSALQNQLLSLGYELPQWGADGDYGGETVNAVMAFQADYGLSPVDGYAGPETRSAVELAINRLTDSSYYPPPLWLGEVAISDTGTWIGPAALPGGTASAVIDLGATLTGRKTAIGTAVASLAVDDVLGATTLRTGTATGAAEVAVAGDGAKRGGGTATGGVLVDGTSAGAKRVGGDAEGGVLVGTFAEQAVTPIPALAGRLRRVGQLAGSSALPQRRLSGTATRR